MAAKIKGPLSWSAARDEEGYVEYTLKTLVEVDPRDGPTVALNCPGLTLPGAFWSIGNDVDPWAYCTQRAKVTPVLTAEPNPEFEIEQVFTTKPPNIGRCQNDTPENPLLVPQKVSGSFVKYVEESVYDIFGNPIINSAFEQIRGQQVEFDQNRPQIRIEQNVPTLDLPILAGLVDNLNDAPLWGLPPRCIKLSNAAWERKFYGQCLVYYTRTLEFDIRYESFDRLLLDEGTKVLSGHWSGSTKDGAKTGRWISDPIPPNALNPDASGVLDLTKPLNPDPRNPAHFIKYKDRRGNEGRVVLDGSGRPFEPVMDTPQAIVPATTVSTISQIPVMNLATTYGVVKIDPADGVDHYFAASAQGKPRRVEVKSQDRSRLIVTILDGKGNEVVGKTPTVTTTLLIVRVAVVSPTSPGTPVSYTIRVDDPGAVSLPGQIPVYKYPSGNLLLLGIPTTF